MLINIMIKYIMIITLLTQGTTFEKIITSLMFYNINLDTEKYKICIICNSKIRDQIDNYIVDFKFNIIYNVVEYENSYNFFKKIYAIKKKLIIEYGSILIINVKALLVNSLNISDSLLQQKIVATKNNNTINTNMFYISNVDTIDRLICMYDDFTESTDISNNKMINIGVINIENTLIKEIYEENDYNYFEQNNILSSLYQFTKEGNEKNYIDLNKFTYKNKLIQFYDIEIVYNNIHNNLLSHVIQQLVKLCEKY